MSNDFAGYEMRFIRKLERTLNADPTFGGHESPSWWHGLSLRHEDETAIETMSPEMRQLRHEIIIDLYRYLKFGSTDLFQKGIMAQLSQYDWYPLFMGVTVGFLRMKLEAMKIVSPLIMLGRLSAIEQFSGAHVLR